MTTAFAAAFAGGWAFATTFAPAFAGAFAGAVGRDFGGAFALVTAFAAPFVGSFFIAKKDLSLFKRPTRLQRDLSLRGLERSKDRTKRQRHRRRFVRGKERISVNSGGYSGHLVTESAHLAELLKPLTNQGIWVEPREISKSIDNPRLQRVSGLAWISMSSAERLGNDLVDKPVLKISARSQGEALRGSIVGLLVGLLPQDGRATFGRDHRVPSVFKHRYSVSDGDSERTPRATFTNDDGNDWRAQPAHFKQIDCDRLSLSALLTSDAGICTGSIDKRDDRQPKLFSELHLQKCFAITLGVRTAEVCSNLFGDGLSLVVTDEHALHGANAREARHDCGIITESSVAMQFAEVAANHRHVVVCLGTKWVASDADGLPRGQAGVDLLKQALPSRVELSELVGVTLGIWALLNRVDLTLDIKDWVLKIELVERAVARSGHREIVSDAPRCLPVPDSCPRFLPTVTNHETSHARYMSDACLSQICNRRYPPGMHPRLAVVGFGNVGHAIVRGAIESGIAAPSEIGVLEPDQVRLDEAREMGLRVVSAQGVHGSEIAVLAVKPQSFAEAAAALGAIPAHGPLIVSVMAGVRSNAIRDALGGHARVVRVMPNTPAAVRRGITAIASDADVAEADFLRAEQLFASVGRTIRVPEALFDAVTAVSGSGPAFVFRFLEAWSYAAEQIGLPTDKARALARETLIGAATLLEETREEPEVLRAKVTSKGGTTAAGVARLDDDCSRVGGLDALMLETLRAARDRGAELGRP